MSLLESTPNRRLVATALLALALAGPPSAALEVPQSQPVSFRDGDVTLSGTLYLPRGVGPFPGVVALHSANGGERDFHAYQHLTTALPATGVAVLLFDRRGSGSSTGDFNEASFQDLAADGVAGAIFLKSRSDIQPACVGVWGISQGGWLAPLAATMSTDFAFVVAVSAPGVSPAGQMDYGATHALQATGQPPEVIGRALRVRAVLNDYYRGRATANQAEQAVAGIRGELWFDQVYLPGGGDLPRDPATTKWSLEMDYDPLAVVSKVRVPIAFFYAESDRWVPVEQSIENVRRVTAMHKDVTIARISGTDHLMETGTSNSRGPTSSDYIARLVEWLQRTVKQACQLTR